MNAYVPTQVIHANDNRYALVVKGDRGVTFTPFVDEESNISWTNDGGLPNPPTVNIRGKDGVPGVITNLEIDEILRS